MTKKLPFLKNQREYVEQNPDTLLGKTLAYMLKNCVGHKNAKTWHELNLGLRMAGVQFTSKNHFQNTVIQQSRTTEGLAIGSSDRCGYFLMATTEDAEVFLGFYRPRLAQMKSNMELAEKVINETPDDYTDDEVRNL